MTRAPKFLTRYRWWIVGLLLLISATNNLSRQTLSVLGPTLEEKLHFSSIQYSYIVSAFLAAYTLGYLFAGRVIDRIGVKLGLGLALVFWSVIAGAHALAFSWAALAGCRFLLGLGESFNSPGAIRAVSEWIPSHERGVCIAFVNSGNVIGAIIATPLVAFLALHFGWQWAFVATGAIGLVFTLVWWTAYDPPEKSRLVSLPERRFILEGRERGAVSLKGPMPTMWQLAAHPICLGFITSRLLTDPFSYFFNFWLPDYFQHARGFSLTALGFVGWLPYFAGDIGGPAGGALSDFLIRRGWKPFRARGSLMLGAACLVPLAANVAVRTGAVWLALALLAVMFAVQTCWMTNQMALLTESFPRQVSATILSLSALGGGIGGILATLLTGRVVKSYGYTPVFSAMSVLHLVACAVLICAFRSKKSQLAV